MQPIDIRAARTFIPPDCTVVAVAPGKTLGGLLFLSYETGSTLEYRELNVVAALVRVGARVAFFLTRLYVDSAASLAGGRTIWGVPKEAATFEVTTCENERTIVVSARGADVCRLRAGRSQFGVRLPIPMPAFGMQEDQFLFFTGRLHARFGLVGARVDLPNGSEFATLALHRPLVTLSLDSLELVVPAPTAMLRANGSSWIASPAVP